MADPNLGIEKAKDTVKKCIYEYGFYDCKLNRAQNNFYIDDSRFPLSIIEEIAKTGKVLAIHVGADAYERTHLFTFRVGKIGKFFPEIQILMVHMGGASFQGLSNAAIEVAQDNKNINLIESAIRSIPILKVIKTLGAS